MYSQPFAVTKGVKQGWVLAPTLFSMVFSAILTDTIRGGDIGVDFRYRTDGKLLFNPSSIFQLQCRYDSRITKLKGVMYQEIGAFASLKISEQSSKFVRLNEISVYARQISKLHSNLQHDFLYIQLQS